MRHMLKQRLTLSSHLFTDSLHVFPPGSSQRILAEDCYADKLVMAWSLPRNALAYCETCDGLCPIASGADTRMPGWPCQDFSRAGLQQGLEGPNLPVHAAVGARANIAQNTLVGVECTPLMPDHLADDMFGKHYADDWSVFHTSPSLVGYDMTARDRLLLHRLSRCVCLSCLALLHLVCSIRS